MLEIQEDLFTSLVERVTPKCVSCGLPATRELINFPESEWRAGWGPFFCDRHTKEDVPNLPCATKPDSGFFELDQANLVRDLTRIQANIAQQEKYNGPRPTRYEREWPL